MGKFYWLAPLRAWGQRHPALVAVAVVLLAYGYYLPTTPYSQQYFDANGYWTSGAKYFATGKFEFTSYFNILRGYLFPLLLAPFTQLAASYDWRPLDMTRLLGAGTAAAVFGWAGPALWQAVRGGAAVPLGRRLVFAALGFALWRNYFNFSLSDFPALLALSAALVGLLRGRGLVSGLLAGMALAAAINMRPVYQAALPVVALLALLPPPGRARGWGWARGAALVVGAVVVLLPQFYSNVHHVSIRSPWVLTTLPGEPNLYLQQLKWGLGIQKYETYVGGGYPSPGLQFKDPRGQALFDATGLTDFTAVGQYARLCLGQPGAVAGVWLRHLFNGLDLQYPTPYIREIFVATWPLAWLNYSVIWLGVLVLLGLLRRRGSRPTGGWARPALVLLALLVPCLAALPTAIECRFLLPLHLLLSAAVAFGASPVRWWRAASGRWRGGVALGYAVVVVAGFAASASAQKHLALMPRNILDDLPLNGLRPVPAPQPW